MPIDPVELELQIADIMFDRQMKRNQALTESETPTRETEDVMLTLLKLMAKDPTLSCPSVQASARRITAELELVLQRWKAAG